MNFALMRMHFVRNNDACFTKDDVFCTKSAKILWSVPLVFITITVMIGFVICVFLRR